MFDSLSEFVPYLSAEVDDNILYKGICSADNLVLNPGTGGATLATDELAGGIHYQIVKQSFGALDTVTLVSTSTPLPVDLRTDNLVGNIDVTIATALPRRRHHRQCRRVTVRPAARRPAGQSRRRRACLRRCRRHAARGAARYARQPRARTGL